MHNSPRFTKLAKAAAFHNQRDGSRNHCSVIAIAAICNVSFGKAAVAMRDAGRTNNKRGASIAEIITAASTLGVTLTHTFPDGNPSAVRLATSLGGRHMLVTKGHIAAAIEGELVDHDHGSRKRVQHILTVAQ